MGIPTWLLAFQFTSPGPNVGPLPIRWYGLLIASAVLIGIGLARNLAKRRQLNPDLLSDLAIWLVIAAIPCARLYYVLFQWQEYAQNPADIIAIWKGGIAIHGAILGGLLAALIFAKLNKISFWQLVDLVVPSLILGQAIGRWGNFFNSEAYGSPTDFPWKLYIPRYERRGDDVILQSPIREDFVHPTFLYESLWNLLVFGLLLALFFRDLKGKPRLKLGTLFLVYMVTYSAGRFWIEGLRTDSLMLGPLRMAQVVSLGGIILGCAGLAWLYLFKRSLPDVAPPLLPAAVAPTTESDQEMVAPGTEGEEGDRESS
jgi:phosphatidylglycerol---prolipoprotein diacylglyceryl transferase